MMNTVKTTLAGMVLAILGVSEGMGAIISPVMLQEGRYIPIGSVITSDSPITFSTSTGEETVWSMECLDVSGEYVPISTSATSSAEFTFDFRRYLPATGSGTSGWSWGKAIPVSGICGDGDVFSLRLTAEGATRETAELHAALMPGYVEVSDMKFAISGFDSALNSVYPYGLLTCRVEAPRATVYAGEVRSVDDPSVVVPPDEIHDDISVFAIPANGLVEFKADWCEYISFRAANEYGIVTSGFYDTNAYITDPAILKRLEELRSSVGILPVGTDGPLNVHYEGDSLLVDSEVSGGYLYDLSGNPLLPVAGASRTDLSGLPTGCYVISVLTVHGETQNFKLIKK